MSISLLLGLAGCGGASERVARVNGAAITKATLDHWVKAMAPSRAAPSADERRKLQAQALSFLISARWRIGEAARRGEWVSRQEISRGLAARAAAAGSAGEFRALLKASGQTLEDVRLEVASELAAAKLADIAAGGDSPIAHSQVAAYYHAHLSRFAVPEERTILITNRKSAAEGEQLKREVAAGTSFASLSIQEVATPTRPAGNAKSEAGLRIDDRVGAALEHAIFTAKRDTLVGPVRKRVDYYVLEVTAIAPRTHEPLAAVEGKIANELATAQRKRSIARFVEAWRHWWKARTDCSAGFVVPKCRQYKPAAGASGEGPYSFD